MTLLAQAEAINALRILIIDVIREVGGNGLFFVGLGVGAMGMLAFLKFLAWMGIKTGGGK